MVAELMIAYVPPAEQDMEKVVVDLARVLG
jgi:hypothetical protein